MSRWEFMRQLEELLFDISPSEREEALQYYNDYFNDAGKENEKEVIEALGSPQQVAEIVKEGLGESAGTGEFTENGYTSKAEENKNALVERKASEKVQPQQTEQGAAKEKKNMPVWAIVLIVIGCIILSPVIIGLFFSIVGVVIGVVASIIGVVIGIGAAALALYIAALALLVAGFASLPVTPVVSGLLIGAGFICAAFGILFMMLTVFLVGSCLPGIIRGISYICRKLFGKKEEA